MLSTRLQWCLGLTLLVAFSGCKPPEPPPVEIGKDYGRPLPPGERALVKLTDPSQFPDFSPGFERRSGLEQACTYSLEYLSRPSSKQFFPYGDITHERAVASVEAFLDVFRTAKSPQELDQMIKDRFDIYISRGCDDAGTVLFTGYYRPIFDGRLQPDAEFKYPLYKRPPDIEGDPITGVYQRKGGGLYYTRAEIDNGALRGKGLELCYLRDRFEAYIVTVQGSGQIRLQDGSLFEIGYNGNNGHEYSSIGQELVKQNLIAPEQLSLQGLIRYFRENPDKLDWAMSINKRYVFFTPRSGGPFGSLNVPVTPFRSIATDKAVFPRAGVSFLMTQVPAKGAAGEIRNYAYEGFACDQDTGGAIRAAGRCDLFMGTGPDVGELAGRTMAEGKLYYIYVKQNGTPSSMLATPDSPSAAVDVPEGNVGS